MLITNDFSSNVGDNYLFVSSYLSLIFLFLFFNYWIRIPHRSLCIQFMYAFSPCLIFHTSCLLLFIDVDFTIVIIIVYVYGIVIGMELLMLLLLISVGNVINDVVVIVGINIAVVIYCHCYLLFLLFLISYYLLYCY